MHQWSRIGVITVGGLLILNGILNIIDDGRVLTFDITTILAGIGFLLLSFQGKQGNT